MNTTHYDVLGVSTTASVAEVEEAFKRCALLTHPDKNQNASQTGTTDYFVAVMEARRVLSNPVLRQEYDTGRVLQNVRARGKVSDTVLRGDFDEAGEYMCRCGGVYTLPRRGENPLRAGDDVILECSDCSLVIAVKE